MHFTLDVQVCDGYKIFFVLNPLGLPRFDLVIFFEIIIRFNYLNIFNKLFHPNEII